MFAFTSTKMCLKSVEHLQIFQDGKIVECSIFYYQFIQLVVIEIPIGTIKHAHIINVRVCLSGFLKT